MASVARRWSTSGWVGVLGLMIGLGPGCSCSKQCNEKGCTSGASMGIYLSASAARLAGQTATVCRGEECYSGVLPAAEEAPGWGGSIHFENTTFVLGTLRSQTDGTSLLSFEWRIEEGVKPTTGDRYTVTLTDATGAVATLLDSEATYQRLSPNGDDCGPICWKANLEP